MPPKSSPAPRSAQTRIFLVDDHPLLRKGIAECINDEPNLSVCGQAGSAAEALPAIARAQPDVVIVDISLPGRDGIELIKDIKSHQRDALIMVYSMHDESLYAERALRAGATGYVMKNDSTENLIQAIHKVIAGEIAVGQRLVKRVLTRLMHGAREPAPSPLACLTNRELEVFRLLGQARVRREMAQQLHLSAKTIETHQSNIRKKLGLSTSNQLRKLAVEFLCSEATGSSQP